MFRFKRSPSRPRLNLWTKLGMNKSVLLMMLKGGISPTVALAFYQASDVATTFTTLGYFVAIVTILSHSVMPRAKYLQTTILSLILVCLAACIALLAAFCATQARAHTTSPGISRTGYNSSASAVSAVWLFFNIYAINALRATWTQFAFPAILHSMFVITTHTNAAIFIEMEDATALIVRLLEAYLAGFAIATLVSLFILPTTSRRIFFKQSGLFIGSVREALRMESAHIQSSRNSDVEKLDESTHDEMKQALYHTKVLHVTLREECKYAKREIAYGKLLPQDIEYLYQHLRLLMLPLLGMRTLESIHSRSEQSEHRYEHVQLGAAFVSEKFEEPTNTGAQPGQKLPQDGNKIPRIAQNPAVVLLQAMDEALQRVLSTLELAGTTQNSGVKAEEKHSVEQAECEEFATRFEHNLEEFSSATKCWLKNVDQSLATSKSRTERVGARNATEEMQARLYFDFLLSSAAKAVQDLLRFAHEKVMDGTMSKSRLIIPDQSLMKEWFWSVFDKQPPHASSVPMVDMEHGSALVHVGDSWHHKRHPEHRTPVTNWERYSHHIASAGRFLSSPASGYGFRVAAATLSIGIAAFLRQSQMFFIANRLVWAMIMVALSMTPTAGSGLFGFFGRVCGLFVATVSSYVMWYIVDGKAPGVIVLFYIFTVIDFYFVLKFPRIFVIVLIMVVSQTVIIGYELQVQKIGVEASAKSLQGVYPLYLLAPYRLAVVCGGLAVATFWTFFPFPVTARSNLRMNLASLLHLLARYSSCVKTTLEQRSQNDGGPLNDPSSVEARLLRARRELYGKLTVLLSSVHQHLSFVTWEPIFGGKFPTQEYENIVQAVQSLTDLLALTAYSSRSFAMHDSTSKNDADGNAWRHGTCSAATAANSTFDQIASTLSLLGMALESAQPLPAAGLGSHPPQNTPIAPAPPKPTIDLERILFNSVDDPSQQSWYAAFAITQSATSLMEDDIEKLIVNVRTLVGEVDFTFGAGGGNGNGGGGGGGGGRQHQ